MLTDQQRQDNKIKYAQLLTEVGLNAFPILEFLESVQYFDKPVTSQQFRAYAGGLCQYALDLCFELNMLCNAYCPECYTKADIVKTALFRDVYRATLYTQGTRNVKNSETGVWETQTCWQSNENRTSYGSVGFSSYMQLRHLVDFSDEQIETICTANVGQEYVTDGYKIKRDFPLVTLLAMADLAVSYLNGTGYSKSQI